MACHSSKGLQGVAWVPFLVEGLVGREVVVCPAVVGVGGREGDCHVRHILLCWASQHLEERSKAQEGGKKGFEHLCTTG